MGSNSKKLSKEDIKKLNTMIDNAASVEYSKKDMRLICLCCRKDLKTEPMIVEERSWHSRDIRECPHCKKRIVPCMNSCGRYYSEDGHMNRVCPSCMAHGAKSFFVGITKFAGSFAEAILKKQR